MKKENLNKTIIGGSLIWWKDPDTGRYMQTATFLMKDGSRDQEVIRKNISEKDYFLYKLRGSTDYYGS